MTSQKCWYVIEIYICIYWYILIYIECSILQIHTFLYFMVLHCTSICANEKNTGCGRVQLVIWDDSSHFDKIDNKIKLLELLKLLPHPVLILIHIILSTFFWLWNFKILHNLTRFCYFTMNCANISHLGAANSTSAPCID